MRLPRGGPPSVVPAKAWRTVAVPATHDTLTFVTSAVPTVPAALLTVQSFAVGLTFTVTLYDVPLARPVGIVKLVALASTVRVSVPLASTRPATLPKPLIDPPKVYVAGEHVIAISVTGAAPTVPLALLNEQVKPGGCA